MKSCFLNSSRPKTLVAKVCFAYVSREVMAHNCASAAEPSTSNFHFASHVFDPVRRLEMVGHTLVVDGLAARQ